MSGKKMPDKEAQRLEQLWAGEFGKQYMERNKNAANRRDVFWKDLLSRYPVKNVLEVGCNIGANLHWLAQILPPSEVTGIDINPLALEALKKNVPGVQAVLSGARRLPFPDEKFELVFTAGVLIHQPEETLVQVMGEVYRLSKRYVLCLEYHSDLIVEVPYRDQSGALFKRPYGVLYQKQFPALKQLKSGFLGRDTGWDDVTWHLFEKGT
jgi:pseudaminic acid biosynthesis-associated methylase